MIYIKNIFKRLFYLLLVFSLFSNLIFANAKNDLNNTIRVNIGSEPGSLDPNYASGQWEHFLFVNIYEGLVAFDNTGKVVPAAAESWKVSADGKTYTFKLRKDAKWSDGQPVVAGDFEFSFKRMLDPKMATRYASNLYIIKGAQAFNSGKANVDAVKVKALDNYTLQVELEYPAAFFIEMLEHPIFYPLPSHVVKKYGKDWVKLENIVFNGAYKLTEWKVKSYLQAVKNPYYYGASSVSIENIMFDTQTDDNVVLDSFRSKAIDFAYNFPPEKIDQIKKELTGEYYISASSGVYLYEFNLTKNAAWQDKRVRQALAMTIDRDVLTNKILKTGEVPAYSYVPPALYGKFNGNSEASFKNLTQAERIETAKKLLQEAGYGSNKPLELTLSYNTLEAHKRIATAIANMWSVLGVKVKTETADANVHYENLRQNNYQVGRSAWVADYQEPSTFMDIVITGGTANHSKYSNKEIDSIVVKAKSTKDINQRFALYQQAEKMALEDMPAIPIYFYVYRNLVSKRVLGYTPNISGVYSMKYFKLAN